MYLECLAGVLLAQQQRLHVQLHKSRLGGGHQLADNGINRETIKGFVREIIEEKIDKSIDEIVHQTSSVKMDSAIKSRVDKFIDDEIDRIVRSEIRGQIQSHFSRIEVTVQLADANGKVRSERSTTY